MRGRRCAAACCPPAAAYRLPRGAPLLAGRSAAPTPSHPAAWSARGLGSAPSAPSATATSAAAAARCAAVWALLLWHGIRRDLLWTAAAGLSPGAAACRLCCERVANPAAASASSVCYIRSAVAGPSAWRATTACSAPAARCTMAVTATASAAPATVSGPPAAAAAAAAAAVLAPPRGLRGAGVERQRGSVSGSAHARPGPPTRARLLACPLIPLPQPSWATAKTASTTTASATRARPPPSQGRWRRSWRATTPSPSTGTSGGGPCAGQSAARLLRLLWVAVSGLLVGMRAAAAASWRVGAAGGCFSRRRAPLRPPPAAGPAPSAAASSAPPPGSSARAARTVLAAPTGAGNASRWDSMHRTPGAASSRALQQGLVPGAAHCAHKTAVQRVTPGLPPARRLAAVPDAALQALQRHGPGLQAVRGWFLPGCHPPVPPGECTAVRGALPRRRP